jgi:hypothetical protein
MRKIYLAALLVGMLPATAIAQQAPSGQALIRQAETRAEPLGYKAAQIFKRLKAQNFEKNIEVSNAWIRAQVKFFDEKATPAYRAAVVSMLEGGGDHGLGMRYWLTDQANVAWWDSNVRKAVGDEGYARVVALNEAFPAGSNEYALTYGYERKYDAATDTMDLNGFHSQGLMKGNPRFKFSPGINVDQAFDELVKHGDVVRKQMYSFYDAYAAKKVKPAQVKAFNAAYVKAGGCAVAATSGKEEARAARYLNALNVMASALTELGFKAE